MDKEILNQYLAIKKEKNDLEQKIKKLKKQSSIVSDIVQNGYKRRAIISRV